MTHTHPWEGGMADQSVSVSGPVHVESESRARVAFDLMRHISAYEQRDDSNPRKYWLDLYSECWRAAAFGETPKNPQARPQRG